MVGRPMTRAYKDHQEGRIRQRPVVSVPQADPDTGEPLPRKKQAVLLLEQAQREVQAKFNIKNFHPGTFLALVAADGAYPIELRVQAASRLLPFVAPTLAAVKVSGDEENPLHVAVQDAKSRALRAAGLIIDNETGDLLDADTEEPI